MAVTGYGCLGRFGPGTVLGENAFVQENSNGQRRTATVLVDFNQPQTEIVLLHPVGLHEELSTYII